MFSTGDASPHGLTSTWPAQSPSDLPACLIRTRIIQTRSVIAPPRPSRAALQIVNASQAKFFVGGNWKANGTVSMVDKLCQVGGRELGREGLVTKLG